ncbi:MAG: hypothetical protein M0P66_02970 [Salinivirgaceae bacterium]|nr:hypothetical protein [Salinivirgaceae bacterium]
MRTTKNLLAALLLTTCLIPSTLFAQDETTPESPFSLGADLYSNYVWRGTKFGTGPAFQPTIKLATGGLTVGAWGSFDAAGYAEADLYASYAFSFGLSLGVTDYYYPGLDYSNFSDTAGSHAIEINAGYTIKGLSLSANYIVNEAGGAASVGGDMYFEAKYAFTNFSVFAGAGNGWHTAEGFKADGVTMEDDEFGLCNLGLSTSKTIKVTDSFSLPVNGSVIWNPHAKQFNMVLGLSF